MLRDYVDGSPVSCLNVFPETTDPISLNWNTFVNCAIIFHWNYRPNFFHLRRSRNFSYLNRLERNRFFRICFFFRNSLREYCYRRLWCRIQLIFGTGLLYTCPLNLLHVGFTRTPAICRWSSTEYTVAISSIFWKMVKQKLVQKHDIKLGRH